MSKTFIYSLESNKLMSEVGVKEGIRIMTELSEKTDIDKKTQLIDSLVDRGYYAPMMSVENKAENGMSMSKAQYEDIASMSGKVATMKQDQSIAFTKEMLDRPFWQMGENSILMSDRDAILVQGKDKFHRFQKTENIQEAIDSDFPQGEPKFFISMRHDDFRHSYKEAKEMVIDSGIDNLPVLLSESDRNTRLAITGVIINSALSLDTQGQKESRRTPEQVMYTMMTIPDECIEEYKNQVGLATVSGNKSMKDLWSGIDNAQKMTKEYITHAENNPDYANNVILKRIDEDVLDKTSKIKEDTVVNGINSIDINTEQGNKKRHFKGRGASPSFR